MMTVWPLFPLSFFNLWALGFLVLAPLLILLYFLKLKRPQIRIASTLLWQKVIEDMRVNSPFQRLKKSLLLLLQLLLLLLLIFALARPWLRSVSAKEESLIVLLDTSASMQAVEADGKTRLDQAKDEIADIIDGLSYRSEMALICFDRRAQTVAPFTANRKRLTRALNRVAAADSTTNPLRALQKAKSLADTRGNPRLLLFSDGAFADPGKVDMKVEYHRIGEPRPNLAITGMDVRRALRDPTKVELFAALHNFSEAPVAGNMTIHLDDKLLDSKPFTIEPQKNVSQIFEAKMPGGGVLKVEFEADDALPLDNLAYLIVPQPIPRRILLVGDNNYYVEKALSTSPEIKLASITAKEFPEHADKGYATIIWNNVKDPQVAAGNNIYLGCWPPVKGLQAEGSVRAPDVADWDATHPLCRFIDFSNLMIAETAALTFPKDAELVLNSSQTPLLGVLERDGNIMVVGGFDIFRSSWPLQVSFVLFLRNCLNYFDEQRALAGNVNLRVGDVIAAPNQKDTPTVLRPDGKREEMVPIPGGGFSYTGVDRCGVYEIHGLADGKVRRLSANLMSREESALKPVDNPISEARETVRVAAAAKVNREYFRTLLIVAVVILFIEWLVYHRRILS